MVNIKKKQKVAFLIELLRQSKNLILVDYGNTPHQQLEKLRRQLKQKKANFIVVKNSLFQKAANKFSLKDSRFRQFKNQFFPLKNNTAIVKTEKNWLQPLKLIDSFQKDQEKFNFKGGMIENILYQENQLRTLAQLPTKEELVSKLIFLINSPTRKFIYSLRFNMIRFLCLLKAKTEENQK